MWAVARPLLPRVTSVPQIGARARASHVSYHGIAGFVSGRRLSDAGSRALFHHAPLGDFPQQNQLWDGF